MSKFRLTREKEIPNDNDFLKDIVRYVEQRIELEALRANNDLFLDMGSRGVVSSVLATLGATLFISAANPPDEETKKAMIEELMESVSNTVIFAVTQKPEDENEH